MGSCGLLDVQTEYRNRNKEVQEQLGTILAQGPDPKGARAATGLYRHTGQWLVRNTSCSYLRTQQHKVAHGGLWREPQAGFRKDAVVQRPGSDRLRETAAHVSGLTSH